jgi:hypothetical protein
MRVGRFTMVVLAAMVVVGRMRHLKVISGCFLIGLGIILYLEL